MKKSLSDKIELKYTCFSSPNIELARFKSRIIDKYGGNFLKSKNLDPYRDLGFSKHEIFYHSLFNSKVSMEVNSSVIENIPYIKFEIKGEDSEKISKRIMNEYFDYMKFKK